MSMSERLPNPIDAGRIVLTPLRVSGADEMVAVLSSPELYVHGGEPPTLDRLRRRYSDLVVGHSPDLMQEWLNWIVRLKGRHAAAVGTVQATIMREDGRAEVAWIIGADWQGHGYGSEAAAAMVHALIEAGAPWVTVHIHPDHGASQAVARACRLSPTEEFLDGERWEWRSDGRAGDLPRR
ncbi:MAG TPA: GNAT family N-acetyltransferase [Actinomycetes bacterium]|jgi:RimJ/RimL family protein N-acetyltransferase